jgi:predicted DNA binding protein
MRELVFELTYEPGGGPLMDLLGKSSDLTAGSIASFVDRDCCWIVEQFSGANSSEIDRIKRIRCDDDGPKEEMTHTSCNAVRHPTVLERSSSTLVTYLFVESLHTCNSIYALAARRLAPGVVVQSRRRGYSHEFRLLIRSEENIETFYERIKETLTDEISINFGHVGSVDHWNYDSLASVSLSQEQRSTLHSAVESGYYETPREITLDELSETLDLPRSTVSYRLRRAEAALAKGYLGQIDHESG